MTGAAIGSLVLLGLFGLWVHERAAGSYSRFFSNHPVEVACAACVAITLVITLLVRMFL